jgi:hypothetical protein
MTRDEAKAKLIRQRDQIQTVMGCSTSSPEIRKWKRDTELAIEYVFGKETRHLKDFTRITYTPSMYSMNNPGPAFRDACQRGLTGARGILDSMISEIEEYWDEETTNSPFQLDSITVIEKLCNRFHLVARQLRSRHASRDTLDVQDEYDVQDLLHALLKIHFDDVRAEEWTPSYAGKSARTDFLLKPEQVVVEVKKTRIGLGEKQIGEQLIIDIARYRAHPDCKKLISFVYDPEGRIGNPTSIESDLSDNSGEFTVLVIVAPKGL